LSVRWPAILLFAASFASASEIKGKVTTVVGGELLGRVQVSVLGTKLSTSTAGDGTFQIEHVPPGHYTIRFSSVGYRLITVPLSVSSDTEVKDLVVDLAPDNFQRTDKVEVHGDVFQGGDPLPVTEMNLTSTEIKEASTVLANDPFRAIQSLPGVSAAGNNELFAEFSVMGAPFSTVGVYLDDVLIPPPFHTIPNVENGASLSLLTSETVQEMKLLPIAYPEKFGDEIGAVLDIRTRDGSRTPPMFRLAPGMADSDFLGEGELGDEKRGSWLVSARKSYIGWLVRNRLGNDFSDISFYDGDMKLSYDIAPGQNLNLYALGGHTNVTTAHPETASTLQRGDGDFYLTRLGWRSSISPHLLLDSHAAFIRQPFAERNAGGNESHNSYKEWSGGSNLVWSWNQNHLLEGGWTLRRFRDSFPSTSVSATGSVVEFMANPTGLKADGYAQESASFLNNKIHLLGGVRYDSQTDFPPHPFSPQASVAVQVARATEVQFGYGRYIQYQFPPFPANVGCLPAEQLWETSNHFTAAVEKRFGENIRLRVEAFDRQSSDIFHVGPSPCAGVVLRPPGTQTFMHDYSHGIQFIAQRRSANRLSGWIGYTLVYARENQLYSNALAKTFSFSPDFSSFEDQRNSLNVFATHRLRPTVSLSGKFLYGSGFPISAGLEPGPNGTLVAGPVTRIGTYLRSDFRVDKSWAFARWTMTLYGEVLNLTNHANRIITSEIFLPNGSLATTTSQALPVTPTAGLAFEF
jgi:CarboxypepD_reg-like domain